jgi:hypothetical protein
MYIYSTSQMCINCNLIAPISHGVCDILGLPRNIYGFTSRSLDILEFLIVDIAYDAKIKQNHLGYDFVPKNLDSKCLKLYTYLKENGLYNKIIDMVNSGKDKYVSTTDKTFVNYVLVKYFNIEWQNDETILDMFTIPLDLLASDSKILQQSIGTIKIVQKELIPLDILEKAKISKDDADAYGIVLLESQEFPCVSE